MKKITKILVILTLFLSAMTTSIMAEEEQVDLKVKFSLEESGYTYTAKWWTPEKDDYGVYYFTLPYGVDLNSLTLVLDEGIDVAINNQQVKNGEVIRNLKVGEENTFTYKDQTVNFIPLITSNIPQIYITTEKPLSLVEKSEETSGQITIVDEEGAFEYDGELDSIKGRGNATWNYTKKPFNIKLEEKTDLFEMGKSKKFSLLANYIDETLVKNKIVCDLADLVGIDFTSKSKIVDLFMDGKYFGNYTIIERVEIDKNRVDIYNLEEMNEEVNPDLDPEDAPTGGERSDESGYLPGTYKYSILENNPEEITGGYLLEYELPARYPGEPSGFVSEYGQPIVIKSPEFASKEQVEYISKFYQEFEDAVLSVDGYNDEGKHYSEYMDVESMAKMYVLHEFVKNLDAGITSFYLYKEVGGKLVAAPVWDFDSSLGRVYTRFNKNISDPEGMWATDLPLDSESDQKNSIIALLCRHSDFRELSAKTWQEVYVPLIDGFKESAVTLMSEIRDSAIVDKTRWNYTQEENEMVSFDSKTIAEHNENAGIKLLDFISKRYDYMNQLFDTENYYVRYVDENGSNVMDDYNFYKEGETLTVRYCELESPDNDYRFDGWDTKADGTGERYQPEDEIVMNSHLVLYPQWVEKGLITKILDLLRNIS